MAGALLVVAAVLGVRGLLVQSFVIPSASMESTLQPGDRVLVWRPSALLGQVERGDVIVFDGSGLFAPSPPAPRNTVAKLGRELASLIGSPVGRSDFAKRVIGLPGDRVVCCDVQGRLSINGQTLVEPYLAPGAKASDSAFDIQVPHGRLWVMGDNRAASSDSRAHLGDPGGGTVPLSRVIGRIVDVWWPLDRAAAVSRGGEAAS